MARGSTYVSRNKGRDELSPMHVVIKDKDIIKYVRAYGKAKKQSNETVVMTCLTTHVTAEELYDGLEREQWELLDEDQKVDVILNLNKQIEQLKRLVIGADNEKEETLEKSDKPTEVSSVENSTDTIKRQKRPYHRRK